MNIFYTPDISGNNYTLSEEESKHCIRVLRKEKGQMLTLVDGRGCWYEAEIVDPNPKRCLVEVRQSREEEQSRPKLHIAIAPTKNNERTEWFLEKATEIGVAEVTLLLCEHSERRQINVERFEKVMISAMKQSLKATLPRLNNLTNFETFVKDCAAADRFIAHCYDGNKTHLYNNLKMGNDVVVLIGPEGDFSEEELKQALDFGFAGISLGDSRLRTETAGVVACEMVNLFWDVNV